MKYRISEIKLDPDEGLENISEDLSERVAAKAFGNKKRRGEISNITIIRESIDARRKPDVKKVYTADFECDLDISEFRKSANIKKAPEKKYEPLKPHFYPEKRPVVVGFGPCGMFAALTLAEAGFKPIVIERGACVETRIKQVEQFWEKGELDPESNVQFGEGGAGTFSDGKLTTNIKDLRCRKVLETFVDAGADDVILYKQKPHIGTDVLRTVVKNIRKRVIKLGGEILFNSRLEEIVFSDNDYEYSVRGINITDGSIESNKNKNLMDIVTKDNNTDGNSEYNSNKKRYIEISDLILAIGHSARDTFEMLYDKGVVIRQKPFSIGVRVQHPQEMIDRAQYGDASLAKLLGPADYKLSFHESESFRNGSTDPKEVIRTERSADPRGRGVYTFCMCPGGVIVSAASEEGGVLTNGMSYASRSGECANSAVLVDVRTSDFDSDHPLAGVEFQRKYERLAFENSSGSYRPPETTWGEFRLAETVADQVTETVRAENSDENSDSETVSDKGQAVISSLPEFAVKAIKKAMPYFGRKIKGFDNDNTIIKAVESRSSSPITIERTENMTGKMNVKMTGNMPENMLEKVTGHKCEKDIAGFYPAGEGAGHAGGIMSAAVDGIKAGEAIIRKFT